MADETGIDANSPIDWDALVNKSDFSFEDTSYQRMRQLVEQYTKDELDIHGLAEGIRNESDPVGYLLATKVLTENTADRIIRGAEKVTVGRVNMLTGYIEEKNYFSGAERTGPGQTELSDAVIDQLASPQTETRKLAASIVQDLGEYDPNISVEKLTSFRDREKNPDVKLAINHAIAAVNKPFGEK